MNPLDYKWVNRTPVDYQRCAVFEQEVGSGKWKVKNEK